MEKKRSDSQLNNEFKKRTASYDHPFDKMLGNEFQAKLFWSAFKINANGIQEKVYKYIVEGKIRGEQGLNGKDGKDGVDGLSVYQLALKNGFKGDEQKWLDSIKGAQGPAGIVDSSETEKFAGRAKTAQGKAEDILSQVKTLAEQVGRDIEITNQNKEATQEARTGAETARDEAKGFATNAKTSADSAKQGEKTLEKMLSVKSEIEAIAKQAELNAATANQDKEITHGFANNAQANKASASHTTLAEHIFPQKTHNENKITSKGGENMSNQEKQPKIIEVKNTTGAVFVDRQGNPLLVRKPKEIGEKTTIAEKPVAVSKTKATEDKPLKVKKGLSNKQRWGLIGTAAILAITGAYFFPRSDKNASPDENKNVPGETTGTSGEQLSPSEAHAQRLIELNKIYQKDGIAAWLKAAGISGNIQIDARQIEQETVTDINGQSEIVASGIQISGTNINVPYPGVMTTDKFVSQSERSYQVDPNNPSEMYTGVKNYKGNATLWVDGQNWPQLAPAK